MHEDRAFLPVVNVSLSYQGILRRQSCIRPKTTVQQMPAVVPVLSVEIRQVIVVEVLCENSIAAIFLDFSAVLHSPKSSCLGAAACRHKTALCLGSTLRNNADHAVHCVGAP